MSMPEVKDAWPQGTAAPARPPTRRCLGGRLIDAFHDVDKATELGVTLSVFCLVFHLWGQITCNFMNPKGMEGLRWPGYVARAMADLMLASSFCSAGETAQAGANILGTISALTIVIQMSVYKLPTTFTSASYLRLFKGLVPPMAYLLTLAIVVPGVVVVLVRMCGRGKTTFDKWMRIATMLGGAVVGYTVNCEIQRDLDFDASAGFVVGTSAVVGFVVVYCTVLLNKTTDNTGVLLVTLLVLYVPLPQIWENFFRPASGAGFDISQIYLSMLGNGLVLARGLHIQNKTWIIRAGWSCLVGGVLQSLSLLIANARLVHAPFLTQLSAILLLAFNGAFLLYASLLVAFMRRSTLVEGPQSNQTMCEGVSEAAV
jgi:hypothetical protein